MNEIIKPTLDLEIKRLEFLGRGSQHNGRSRNSNLIYKCVKCGGEMQASFSDYWNCTCGAVSLDYDTGRFGSKYGDINVLTYRKTKTDKSLFEKITNLFSKTEKTLYTN
jgi:hypothetical protein